MKKGFKKLLGAALSVAMLSQGLTFAVSADATYDYDTSKNVLFGMATDAGSVQLSRWNGSSAGWKRSCLMDGISVSSTGYESAGNVWYAPAAANTQTSVTFNLKEEYIIDTVEVTSGYLHKNSVTGYEYLDSYWVEYWNGSSFVKAEGSEVTGNDSAVSGATFTAVKSNKFRLVTNTDKAVRVREVRLWLEGEAPEIIETPEEVNLISGVAVTEASPAVDAAVLTDGAKANGAAGWTVGKSYDYDITKNVLFGIGADNINLSKRTYGWERDALIDGISSSADGNTGSASRWYLAATDAKYAEFTLPKEYYVDGIEVTSGPMYGSNDIVDTYYIEYWNGTEYVKVADSEVTGNTSKTSTKSFEAVKSNKFRFVSDSAKAIRIREIILFAADVDGYDNSVSTIEPAYVVLPIAEKENVTHIALYSGSGAAGAFAQGIDVKNVKVYYNDGKSDWTAAKVAKVNTVTQESNNLTLKARQITYLEIEPVIAKNIKLEILDTDFTLLEAEVYYADANKLFGTVATTVVEAGAQDWGNAVDMPGFVLTDGISNNPNNIGKWYMYNSYGTPYAQFELGGKTIDTVKIWAGNAQRGEVADTYRTKIAYSEDGVKWTEALIKNVEYSRSGSTELKDVMTCTIGSVTANYLRVYFNSQESDLGAIRVKEIAAYNTSKEAAEKTFTVVSAKLDDVNVSDMKTDVANNADKLTMKLLSTPDVIKVGGKQCEFTANRTTIEIDMPTLPYNTWFDVEADGIRLLSLKTIPEVSVTNKQFVKADGNIIFYGVITDNAGTATADTKLIFTTEKNGVLNAVKMEDVTFGTENSIMVEDGENPSVYLWAMDTIKPLANKVVSYAQDEVVIAVDEAGFIAYVKNDASTEAEYIGYRFYHEVSEATNSNLYRMKGTKLYERLDDFAFVPVNDIQITGHGEYEMAIKEKSGDGADFVGGFHGDELIDSVTMTVDGKEVSLSESGFYKGQNIVFTQNATVNASGKPDLKLIDHEKIYTITKDGIKLNQTAEWLNDSTVSEVYMAMLPINHRDDRGVQINDTITAGGVSYYRPRYFEGVKFNAGYTNALSVTATGGALGAKIEVTTKPVQGFADSDIQFFMYTRETNDNKVYFRSLRANNNTFAVSKGEVWEVENTYKVTVE